jgi:hypothetical protein
MKPLQTHILLLLAASLLVGCKPKSAEESTTKTLDNFSRDDSDAVSSNACVGSKKKQTPRKITFEGVADSKKSKLRNAVNTAYSAVPWRLHQWVLASKGSVVVSNKSSKICGKSLTKTESNFVKEAGEHPESCWQLSGKNIKLVLPDDEKAIRHNLVRLAGYVYTQALYDAVKGKPKLKSVASRYKDTSRRLAKAFWKDLKSQKKNPKNLAKLKEESISDFRNFVVAEAIDSYYCNKSTYKDFRQNFPETFDVFTRGVSSIASDLGKRN